MGSLLALSLLAAPGCARERVAAPAQDSVAIFHVAENGAMLMSALVDRLDDAGIERQVLAVAELPPERIPAAFRDRDDGWLLFVRGEQRSGAEAVRDAWLRSLEVEAIPPTVAPFPLGAAAPVPPELVEQIRTELAARRELDQAVRIDSARHAEMPAVDADNTAWLKSTVAAHGWIDPERFGGRAAGAAFLLVQHSGDLPLMLAALPRIERGVRSGRLDPQDFALLYDRLERMQGRPQRYGSQLVWDAEAKAWVLAPLADPEKVDERRAALGMGPLAEYLKHFEGLAPPR